jgi:FkbM family methyltransferase
LPLENQFFDTPVLFLIFNRPDVTERVFGQVRKVQPKQLFIGADGPRADKPGEKEKCEATRQLVLDMIDWECEVKTLFRDENLGCGLAVSQAITWFFEHVEMGIILEDDCYPDLSFFPFCEELLEYYKDDERVMHIGGTNWQFGKIVGTGSYYFSNQSHVWGWATWRNAWKHYDHEMIKWENDYHLFNKIGLRRKEITKYYNDIFTLTKNGAIDTWDYKWKFSIWHEGGNSIIPNRNLVANVGFEQSSTHTSTSPRDYDKIRLESIKDLDHPLSNDINYKADYFYFNFFLKKNLFSSQIGYLFKKALFALWNKSPKDYYLSIQKREKIVRSEPKWEQIELGPAKQCELFVDKNRFPGWNKMIDGTYDSFLFKKLLRETHISGKTIWDVGAHFGFHTLTFAKLVGKSGKILSFEPNTQNFIRLQKHIKHNKIENVEVFNLALSNKIGDTQMMVSYDIDGSQSTGSFLLDGIPSQEETVYKSFNFQATKVYQSTIDELVQSNTSPDVLKIDVEGAEFLVLSGGIQYLQRNNILLFIEIHSIILMHEVQSLLNTIGYKTEVIGKDQATKSRCFIYARKC